MGGAMMSSTWENQDDPMEVERGRVARGSVSSSLSSSSVFGFNISVIDWKNSPGFVMTLVQASMPY